MTDEFLRSQADEFFKFRRLDSSPCSKCANLQFKRSGTLFSCPHFNGLTKRNEWFDKYWRPDGKKCPFFQEGKLQLID